METKKKKDIGPIWGWLLLTALGLLIYVLVASFFGSFFNAMFNTTVMLQIVPIVLCLIYLIIYNSANKKTFDGVFKTHDMKAGFMTYIPWAIVMIVSCFISFVIEKNSFGLSSAALLTAFYAGICEESVFRAVPVAHMMRYYDDKKKVMLTVILTSAFFGVFHATNILSGADVLFTLFQVFSTFAIGMLLCTSYIISGSIIPAMVLHILHDIVALASSGSYSDSGIFKSGNEFEASSMIIQGVIAAIFIASSIWLLKKYSDSAVEIWDKKWHKSVLAMSATVEG